MTGCADAGAGKARTVLDKVTIAYRGATYEIGRGRDYFGIWTVDGPRSQPLEWWPETQEGWSAAWARFAALEAPDTITPAGRTATRPGEPRGPTRLRPRRSAAARWPPRHLAAAAARRGRGAGDRRAVPGLPGRDEPGLAVGQPGRSRDLPGRLGRERRAHRARRRPAADRRAAGHRAEHRDVRLVPGRRGHADRRGRAPGRRSAWCSACWAGWPAPPDPRWPSADPAGPPAPSGRSTASAARAPVPARTAARRGARARRAADPGRARHGRRLRARPGTASPCGPRPGRRRRSTAGNAFAEPGAVIAGNVVVMVALAAVVIAAALWRPARHGAVLLAGAIIPMAAQAISALIQVGEPISPTQFGFTPAQASQLGLTVSAGLTPCVLDLLRARRGAGGLVRLDAVHPAGAGRGWPAPGPGRRDRPTAPAPSSPPGMSRRRPPTRPRRPAPVTGRRRR